MCEESVKESIIKGIGKMLTKAFPIPFCCLPVNRRTGYNYFTSVLLTVMCFVVFLNTLLDSFNRA